MRCIATKYLYVFILLLSSFAAKAANDDGLWCNGRIELDNGELLEGEINYDLKFEVIQIRTNGMLRAFTAENVVHFSLFDPVKYRQRDYVSLEYEVSEAYKRKTFFEVVADGNLTVLRKSRYVRRPRITEDNRAPHIYLNNVCRHSYFVVKDQKWTEIDNFKTTVLSWMDDFEQEIDQYISQHRLKLKNLTDRMRVVSVYNQLSDSRKLVNQQAELRH